MTHVQTKVSPSVAVLESDADPGFQNIPHSVLLTGPSICDV